MGEEAATETRSAIIRIYLGGLGKTVTGDDLKKTFSAPHLGTVSSVEVIRTKGRSFAYLDFLPSSDKGLAKLFSTYNGCMWKGGKLRLEKAKEHYLLRLKREWEEDTELSNNSCGDEDNVVENAHPIEKPKKRPNFEKMQLQIFFPKLRKVKPVPFKGTGKHKYSFQRVEVPPIPTHFCDCEEHSGALHVAKGHQHPDIHIAKQELLQDNEMVGGEINEEELNMINSVMNKLLERENPSKVSNSNNEFAAMETHNDLPVAEDQSDQMSDEDNLILNMVGGSKNNFPDAVSLSGNLSAINNRDVDFKELRDSKNRPAQKLHASEQRETVLSRGKRKRPKELKDDGTVTEFHIPENEGRKIAPSNKKQKANLDKDDGNDKLSASFERWRRSDVQVPESALSAELKNSGAQTSDEKAARLQKSTWKSMISEAENNSFQIADIIPSVTTDVDLLPVSENLREPHSGDKQNPKIEEPKVAATLSSDGKAVTDKSTKGASWLQKSSWTQLVGGSDSGSFSISHILPNATFDKQDIQQPTRIDFSRSSSQRRQSHAGQVSASPSDVLAAHDSPTGDTLANREGNYEWQEANPENNQIDREINEASTSSSGKKQHLTQNQGDSGADETFAFVRTAASMREFAKVKAALSGSLKKLAKKQTG